MKKRFYLYYLKIRVDREKDNLYVKHVIVKRWKVIVGNAFIRENEHISIQPKFDFPPPTTLLQCGPLEWVYDKALSFFLLPYLQNFNFFWLIIDSDPELDYSNPFYIFPLMFGEGEIQKRLSFASFLFYLLGLGEEWGLAPPLMV